jgi:hypothetical protein
MEEYPTFEELNTTPDYLEIGVSARYWLMNAGWITVPELTPDERTTLQRLTSDQRRGWFRQKFAGKRIA